MKRRRILRTGGLAALSALAAPGCSVKGFMKQSDVQVDSTGNRSRYLRRMLSELCADNTPRPAGSAAYDAAARIVRREMEKALPLVKYDPFTFDGWFLRDDPVLEVGSRVLEGYPVMGSTPTPSEGIEGFLAVQEDKTVQYAVLDSAGGKIGEIAIYQGGKAVSRTSRGFGREPHCLPLFVVGKQDGPFLAEAASNRARVRMKSVSEFVSGTPTVNVVGTLPGESDEELLFVAHLDTVYTAPGANDNAASLVGMLMLAHAVAGKRPKKTLTFVATSCEEVGFHGARHYFERRRREGTLDRIVCSYNFDSVTWGPDMIIQTRDRAIRERFLALAQEIGSPASVKAVDADGDILDNLPLKGTGVKCVYVGSEGSDAFKYWHRPEDIPKNVSPSYVENAFVIFHRYLVSDVL